MSKSRSSHRSSRGRGGAGHSDEAGLYIGVIVLGLFLLVLIFFAVMWLSYQGNPFVPRGDQIADLSPMLYKSA